MIEGLILGFISWLSLFMSWSHFPESIKKWTLRHPVITDLSTGVLVYLILSSISKSIVAAVGAVFSGLLVNLSLFIGTKREIINVRIPNDDSTNNRIRRFIQNK